MGCCLLTIGNDAARRHIVGHDVDDDGPESTDCKSPKKYSLSCISATGSK